VTVESVDHVFQTKMLDMLKQTGRPEMVVGWYHSHPGFGCWLSSVDVNTQQVRSGPCRPEAHASSRSSSSIRGVWLLWSTRSSPSVAKSSLTLSGRSTPSRSCRARRAGKRRVTWAI
jgi:hypothetical protein